MSVKEIVFVLALTSAAAVANDLVDESDHVFDVGATLSIDSSVGILRVRGTDNPVAHLKTIRSGRDGDKVSFDISANPKSLAVRTVFPQGNNIGNLEYQVEIIVDVPNTAGSMTLNTSSGNIEINSCKAQSASVMSNAGNITMSGFTGKLKVACSAGNVTVNGLKCDTAQVDLTAGSLNGGGEVRELSLKTISGNATFDLIPPQEGKWSVHSSGVSSSLQLTLPGHAGALLKASVQSGHITCGFELRDRSIEKPLVGETLTGTFGDGTGTIHATAVSGNISILSK